ncbi:LAFE_0D08548g1_1 [Lachancea fermentati]|uniref:Ubiquitin carboxyl-terminal hydrolase n=1 Tax=Lachancea fermentati TaxID=4955 RepID=A0A1G4MBN8_LACFM|nr:LAFE_0D08548g1_1 [Lachancea fermentati]
MSLPTSVVPLESNPEVFTKFAHSLGLSESYAFHDIYSLTDPDLLAFLSRPMKAIIMLFPLNSFFESSKNEEDLPTSAATAPTWFKQNVRNACGLYALLHSLSNNTNLLKDDSKLIQFLQSNPRSNCQYADDATDNFIVSVNELYNENSSQGQTEAPEADAEVNLHFITFVEHEGNVFELDGRRPTGAKLLGPSSSIDLLEEPIVKKRFLWYTNNSDDEMKLNFSLLGLAPSWD